MSLRVQIDPKLEHKFREAAMKKYGYAKGSLSKAAEEAILNWLPTPIRKGQFLKATLLKLLKVSSKMSR